MDLSVSQIAMYNESFAKFLGAVSVYKPYVNLLNGII